MNPEVTSGGRAIQFYTSIRLNVRAGEKIPDPKIKGEDLGQVVNIKVTKNKTARPNKIASFSLIYGVGIDKTAEIADMAITIALIDKGGAWLRIKGADDKPITRKWIKDGEPVETIMNFQGKDRFIDHLYEDTELCELFKRAIYGETITIEDYMGNKE